MATATKTKGLGRGLSSLMSDEETAATVEAKKPVPNPVQKKPNEQLLKEVEAAVKEPPKAATPAPAEKAEGKAEEKGKAVPPPSVLPIASLTPTPLQPRKNFAPEQLRELANSIKTKGLLQPILVRKSGKAGGYEIVAGERRWRAAQKAKLHEVPVVVKHLNNQEVLQIAIIENIQREDLSSVEEARAYARLIDDFSNTQEDIAKFVSKSRSHVANLLRLLTLPEDVIELIETGKLSMGHARALVGQSDASALAKKAIKEKMTVRDVERLTSDKKAATAAAKGERSGKDADTKALEQGLSEILGLKVAIAHSGKSGGKIAIKYKTLEQLGDICDRLKKEPS